MIDKPNSALRQRMSEDTASRRFKEKVQKDYLRHVRNFSVFLGRSPDTATAEDVRLYQLHLAEQKIGAPSINAAVAALRFFFNVTLERPELARHLAGVRRGADRPPRSIDMATAIRILRHRADASPQRPASFKTSTVSPHQTITRDMAPQEKPET